MMINWADRLLAPAPDLSETPHRIIFNNNFTLSTTRLAA